MRRILFALGALLCASQVALAQGAAQQPNLFWATPASGTGFLGLRAIALSDLSGTTSNIAASTLLGNPTGSPAAAQPITITSPLAFSGTSLGVTTPITVPNGGTGLSTFTSNLPLIGNGAGNLAQGTRSGNTTSFATTSGTLTNSHCVSIDPSGNFVDAGAICGTGGGGGIIAANTLLGNPTGSAATPQAVSLLSSLAFSGTSIGLSGTLTSNVASVPGFNVIGTIGAYSGGYGFIESDVTNNPSSPSSGVMFSILGRYTYNGTATPGFVSHFGGLIGWTTLSSTGVTVPLMIGTEGRLQVTAGTCSTCVSSENQVAANSGTISQWLGSDNAISSNTGTIGIAWGSDLNIANSGTITEAIGFGIPTPSNTGTIGTLVGYFFPDMSGVAGIGAKYSILEQDAAAILYHLGPVTLGAGVKLSPMTIASLPVCNSGSTGTVAFASDTTFLNAVAFHAVVAGGGAISAKTMVSCNGTNWVYD